MRSPYEIWEKIYGEYKPSSEPTYRDWYYQQKMVYYRVHPGAEAKMVHGDFYEEELIKFFKWVDDTHRLLEKTYGQSN
jgi:hypothetical protein